MGKYKYSEVPDSYCYPGTDILKNKRNIKEPERLDKVERQLSGLRRLELQERPLEIVI